MNKESLRIAKITGIEDFHQGIRVLVDFMEELKQDDFVLVGNTMHGFFPVVSENHLSPDYRPRKFRFNVGALHQYILRDADTVGYVDELAGGDAVAFFSSEGERLLHIGRIKKETRQFVKITAEYEGSKIALVAQKGATVAVLTPGGIARVQDLSVGDPAFVFPWGKATHLGGVVEEFAEEE